MKPCALEVYSTKLNIHQICTCKIRDNIVLLTPCIPSLNTLLQNFQMFGICHRRINYGLPKSPCSKRALAAAHSAPADTRSRRASVLRRVTSAVEPQNGSTSRVVRMGRYCRINGASARLLP